MSVIDGEPVERLREAAQEARVEQRPRRPGGQVPVPAGQQRPRRFGVLVVERPEPGQHPAPAAGLQGQTVEFAEQP